MTLWFTRGFTLGLLCLGLYLMGADLGLGLACLGWVLALAGAVGLLVVTF